MDTPMTEPAKNARTRILLVDDDEEDYLITADIIAEVEGTSFDIEWRSSLAAAVEALEHGQYDVLVFDYRLGPDTGIDLLRHVVERHYPAPVILLTGQQDNAVDNEAIREGASDYLIKGKITPDSFARAVRHALEKHRTLAELRSSNAFLQSIIDALPSEIAILGADGAITTVNAAWREAFQGEPARGIGANFGEWPGSVHEVERDATVALAEGIRRVLGGETPQISFDLPLSAGGLSRWAHARASAFAAHGRTYVVFAYEDITVRKLAEAQLHKSRERLQELSIRDELTSQYNRRYFNMVLKEELDRSQRYGKNFAVLLLDIDHFKSVNDTHGHAIGDLALQHVARIANHGCRTTDAVARYGGEEFSFILPETRTAEAIQFAERIRLAIAEAPLDLPGERGGLLRVTASFGVAVYPEDGEDTAGLLEIADKGLYLAKEQGRNRVCHAGRA